MTSTVTRFEWSAQDQALILTHKRFNGIALIFRGSSICEFREFGTVREINSTNFGSIREIENFDT